jgi:hypothetical protein
MRVRFSPLSFLLGLAAAGVVPLVARTFRPLAVQATATALDVFENGQRVFAEQKEAFEDILAEAKVQREAVLDSARRPTQPDRRARRKRPEGPARVPAPPVSKTAAQASE